MSCIFFCGLCIKQIELENHLNIYINEEGWDNIIPEFNALCNVKYKYIQFKNKWDQLKEEYKLWRDLKRGSIGLG